MVEDIKKNLLESFDINPNFDSKNIGRDNSVEDKIFSYAIKMTSQFKVDLKNFYERMKTFKLKPLSVYANKGFVSYDPVENIGYISKYVLTKDDNNEYNVDNLFTQIMLMVTTANNNYYGFGNEELLRSLNDACTYMIASNLSGSATKNYHEEELVSLNLLNILLEGANI